MLREATGLNLSKTIVDRAVKNRMQQTAASNQDDYLAALTPAELTQLIELVVVPESWMFRDPQAFQAALEFIQARSGSASSRPARILSIPCAGGEEPYSIAMAMFDAGVAREAFMIDAYDISPGCIARAQGGIYGRNAFRSSDLGFRDRYFTPIGDEEYQIGDQLRKQVRFKQGNLLTLDLTGLLGYYDVIFCRNLLIYFDKPTTKAAIGQLRALLSDDGLLFAGYAEVPSFCQHGYTPIRYPQAFGLKKETAAPERPAVRAKPAHPAAQRKARVQPAAALPIPAVPASRPATGRNAPAKPSTTAVPPSAHDAGDPLEQARKLADQGRHKEADALCLAHLARAPDSAEAYFILGLLNEHAQKMNLAEDYWRRCIYLQPDHYEALCHLALLAEQQGDASAAATLKARAARIYKRQQA
jgi:chemotaxis protein methyltransferase WspC